MGQPSLRVAILGPGIAEIQKYAFQLTFLKIVVYVMYVFHEHLQVGPTVRVKVIDIKDQGKINLSIKRVADENKEPPKKAPDLPERTASQPIMADFGEVAAPTADLSFEEKLKKFMQASDSKNADKRRNTERKQHTRRK